MKKNLVNILYNPGSVSSVKPSLVPESLEEAVHSLDRDYHILEVLEELVVANNRSEIKKRLETFRESLDHGISVSIQKMVLKEFNTFLSRTMKKYVECGTLFQLCVETVIEIKKHMNEKQGILGKDAWVELERSIYLLSSWENRFTGLDGFQVVN